MSRKLLRHVPLLKFSDSHKIYYYSILVGLISGLGAVLFRAGLDVVSGYFMVGVGGLEVHHPHGEVPILHFSPEGTPIWWFLILLPAVGGLLSGWIVYRYAPEAAGHGTDAMIDSFHNKGGNAKVFTSFIKSIGTILTLGSGGSAGKEGPVAQIGAGFGSFIALKLKMGTKARRTLLLAGTAGGLGAIFQAPLGGALTAVEVLYREDIESDALIPCIISSVTAYVLYGMVFGFSHIFILPEGSHFVPSELVIFIFLGFFCGAVGFVYVKTFYFFRDSIFEPLKCPNFFKPAIGGLGLGLVGFCFPQILGSGLGAVQGIIHNGNDSMTWGLVGLFVLLAFLKILATSLTVGSGGSGGVFAPSLFIGALLGAAVGGSAFLIFPSWVESPLGAFVVVGMASFFAGVAHAPIAAMIIISEMTGGYELLAPLMLISVLAIIFSRNWSIYQNQVHNKFFSKAHVGDMTIDILQDIKVSSLHPYRKVGITNSQTLFQEAELLSHKIRTSDLILVDNNQVLSGMVSLHDIHFDHDDPLMISLVTLEDIKSQDIPIVTPDNNLHEALEILMKSEFDKVPVLDSEGEEAKLIGYILYNDIFERYHGMIHERSGDL